MSTVSAAEVISVMSLFMSPLHLLDEHPIAAWCRNTFLALPRTEGNCADPQSIAARQGVIGTRTDMQPATRVLRVACSQDRLGSFMRARASPLRVNDSLRLRAAFRRRSNTRRSCSRG